FPIETPPTQLHTLSLHDALPISDARVAMTEADWALMERSNRAGAGAIPGRDIVIKDGDSIKLGDTTLKMYVTPGHTPGVASMERSEEHTSELQSQSNLVCRLLLE